ncbi:xanthine dehydrogenase family protein molybdopterin-binding subunit, partial [Chloroflexota bacterium]
EPHGCISSYNPYNGKLTHWTGNQSVLFTLLDLCESLHMPANKVRIIVPEAVGGGFGSKAGAFPYDVCAALMSIRLGKPVKMVLSREEEFMATRTRYPFIRKAEIGLKRDGTIVAWKEKMFMDIGAYAHHGEWVATVGNASAPGLYKIPNVWIDTYLVYTNKSPSGPFRGFGNPQATFARESLLDIAADQMGMDPAELRLKNIIRPEDLPFTTSTGLVVRSCGIEECIKKVADAVGWRQQRKPNVGVGIACTVHPNSVKYGPKDPDADFASAQVEVAPDSSVKVRTGNSDPGVGLYTILAQIAAEELGIPLEKVTVLGADSEATPPDMGCFGSRSALTTGTAVKTAAAEIKKKLFRIAGKMLGVHPEDLAAKQGNIFVKNEPNMAVAIEEVTGAAYFSSIDGVAEPIIGYSTWVSKAEPVNEDGYGNIAVSYSFAANAIEIEVDPETGRVNITKFVNASDVGKALNIDILEGQLQGAAAQGIGYGLLEDLVYNNKTGQPLNPLLIDYKVPTAADLPDMELIIIETIDPESPFGNKGVGEYGLNCVAPAIANAIYDAIGIRINDLPITPEKLLQALKKKRGGQ